MKVAIYVRVSTQEQAREGFSIPAQLESLRAFCKSQNWEIVDEYKEEGKSAKTTDRPQIQKLLKDMKRKKFELVLVHKLDRFTRSVSDLYDLLEYMEKYEVKFRSATEVYDTTTAMGRLFITLVAALAQWERENLAERVKFGIEQMIDEGKRPGGHSPYGYKFDKLFNCTIIEKEATWLVKIFNWYIQGLGYRKIANKLNEYQVPPRIAKKWNAASIFKLLHNDIYIGIYRWGTKTIIDNHPAIIDHTTYLQVQKRMEQKQTDRSRYGKFPFTGILTCGSCNGHPINGFADKREHKIYYRCIKCNRITDSNKITAIILEEIEKLTTSKNYFLKKIQKEHVTIEINVKEIKKKLKKIESQKEKWYDLFIDGDNPIPKETLYSKINKLNEEETELITLLNSIEYEEPSDKKFEKLSKLKDIRFIYEAAHEFEKKEMLHSIFSSIILFRDKGKNNPITLDYTLN